MKVLVIDVGGTNLKLSMGGREEPIKVPSDPGANLSDSPAEDDDPDEVTGDRMRSPLGPRATFRGPPDTHWGECLLRRSIDDVIPARLA